MKLYIYSNNNGELSEKEVDVVEKVVYVASDGSDYIMGWGSQISKENINKNPEYSFESIILDVKSKEKAREMFIEYERRESQKIEEELNKRKLIMENLEKA